MLGAQDLLITLAIGVFVFGSKKLPELAGALGQSIKEFKKGTTEAPEPAASVTASTPALTAPGRLCGSCRTALGPEWTHCPKCGAAAPPAG
jgi:TatA/E family protein of Tat protein translocase